MLRITLYIKRQKKIEKKNFRGSQKRKGVNFFLFQKSIGIIIMVILSSHWGILVRNREHPTRPALMHYTIYETHVNTNPKH